MLLTWFDEWKAPVEPFSLLPWNKIVTGLLSASASPSLIRNWGEGCTVCSLSPRTKTKLKHSKSNGHWLYFQLKEVPPDLSYRHPAPLSFISNLKKSRGLKLLTSSSAVFYFQLKEVPPDLSYRHPAPLSFISNLKKSRGLQLLTSSSAVFYFQLKEVPRTSATDIQLRCLLFPT